MSAVAVVDIFRNSHLNVRVRYLYGRTGEKVDDHRFYISNSIGGGDVRRFLIKSAECQGRVVIKLKID